MNEDILQTKIGQQVKINIERDRTKRMMTELSVALNEKITFWDLGFKESTDYSLLNEEGYKAYVTTHYFLFYKGKKYVFINEMIEKIQWTQETQGYSTHVSEDRIRTYYQKDFVKYSDITPLFGKMKLINDNIIEIEQFDMKDEDIMSLDKMTNLDYDYINRELTKVLEMESESKLAYMIESVELLCKVNGEIKVYDIDELVDLEKLDTDTPFFVNDNKGDIKEIYIFENSINQNIIDYIKSYYCSDGGFDFDNLQFDTVKDGLIKIYN